MQKQWRKHVFVLFFVPGDLITAILCEEPSTFGKLQYNLPFVLSHNAARESMHTEDQKDTAVLVEWNKQIYIESFHFHFQGHKKSFRKGEASTFFQAQSAGAIF